MSDELTALIAAIQREVDGHDDLNVEIGEIYEREEAGGGEIQNLEWIWMDDARTEWADSHHDVLRSALEYLKKVQANTLHVVYLADGGHDNPLLYRDAAEADKVVEVLCGENGPGYAWADSVTVH
ncbi:hypothetical protein OG474_30150 [Kribbella sp. NBC_01505]|uniref:hypothetical protein n=1 Tax=Kribbella sp. NBC_01505 TaxID=2903580 RepID=UPI0038688639